MCCFRLHFSNFSALFFQKNKKLLLKKNNLLCKKREKNNVLRGKIPAPLDIKLSVPYVAAASCTVTHGVKEKVCSLLANLKLILMQFCSVRLTFCYTCAYTGICISTL